jgi:hypothetical protein|tara:strand:+ start:78 stop:1184 length:1107 start_codon:yes stop_codon:yes gene_type:complete
MIKAGMTVAEAIAQLTRGFIKIMGRNPDGLEKIKIKQEAVEKLKDLEKVVDLQGNVIDTSKGIMGGQQIGMFDNIFNKMQKQMGKGDPKVVKTNMKKMIDDAIEDASPGFADDIKYDAEIVAENLAERMGLVYDDLPTKQRLDLYDQAYTGLSKQRFKNKPKPEDKAYGGRIGLKDGPDLSKRNFMKILGGLAAIPVFGKFFKQADKVAPAAEKVAEVAGQAPSYFFDLVAKIKLLGEPRRTPSYKERVNEYQYTGKDGIEYELIEDLDTGEIMIQKDKIGVGGSGDKSFDVIEDRTELRYKKPKPDEGDPNPTEEYEEFKVEFDSDGTAADATEIDEISKMEIMKEITDEAPPIKKAGGGLAYMLGE